MKKSILGVAVALLMVSCNMIRTTTAKSKNISGIVKHIPVVADLDVKQTKVSFTMEFNGKIVTNAIKNIAIGEVLRESKADILIEPTFVTEIKRGKKSKITVKGFPATYKNFRNATKNDVELLKIGSIQKVMKSVKSESLIKGLGK